MPLETPPSGRRHNLGICTQSFPGYADTMHAPKILVVDDDIKIRDLVRDLLERNHMLAITADGVATAERLLEQERFDMIVLDIMMPGEDGTSYCRRLRQTSNIPILMLSALGEDIDRIVGLEMGADDYLAKPFNPRELIARIKSILRRSPPLRVGESHQSSACLAFDRFRMYPDSRQLETAKGPVEVTSGEFALLLALAEASPRILSRDQLLDLSRGAVANPFDRSIDTHISRLRRKLEQDPKKPVLIKTVRNLGYALAVKVERTVA